MENNTPHWEHKQEDGRRQLQVREEKLSFFTKRILVVDDDPDVTFTFKKAFEEANRIAGSNKISLHVNTYNDPLVAFSEFKPNLYDLMLIDINMPELNGFDFCVKVLLTLDFALCLLDSLIRKH